MMAYKTVDLDFIIEFAKFIIQLVFSDTVNPLFVGAKTNYRAPC